MFYVEMVCSDESCDFTLETEGELVALEALVCECGCCIQVVSISEAEFVVPAPPFALPLAA